MIQIAGLKKTYDQTTILDIPAWRLDPGTNGVLVGPNGAGKTTLLTMLAGLSYPTTGVIAVAESPVGSRRAREVTTFIPDQPALFDDLTIEEQMLYVAKLNGQKEPTDFSLELVDILDAGELLDRFPQTMSKGQRQKSGLIVGTARPFKVLLLDEPTTGLDARSRVALIEMLADFADKDGLVLSSTHDPELIERANTVIEIRAGELH